MATMAQLAGRGTLATLSDWFDRARGPGGPLEAAERQFDALTRRSEVVPGLAAYDHLFDLADLALRWLEVNPCPDQVVMSRLKAQMMGYRAVADTVRSTITNEDGDAMVAQLIHLRQVIEQHAEAVGEREP
jgi:hypothetical protein